MNLLITVRTELFNYREVKPHFINPCCFAEDFALWLKGKVAPLEDSGFKLSEIIQEDYGWGFWAREGKEEFLRRFLFHVLPGGFETDRDQFRFV